MATALISIWAIATLAIVVGAVIRKKLCPACVGVLFTWLWMLVGYYVFAYNADIRTVALLMGGSVVGAAYTLEKRLPPSRSPGLWKLIAIPMGFLVVYGVLAQHAVPIIVGAVVLLAALWYFFRKGSTNQSQSSMAKKLEEQLKNCC